MHRTLAVMRKEFIHIFRDPRTLAVMFLIPIIQLVLLGYAATTDVDHIEQLIVTPLKSYELIIGKLVPYVFIAFCDTLEVLAIGSFWFGVPIHGSIMLLLALSVLALMTSLGLGLFISTVSNTQQESMLLSYFIMLPSIFLSGFMFPIAAMPKVLQYFSYVVPLTYFLIIVRGIILKGIGLELLADQVIAMAVFGVVLLALAAARFRKRLE